MKAARNYKISPAPPDPGFNTLLAEELEADHVYYARNSYKYGTSSQALDGEHVGSIRDMKGNAHMNFIGTPNALVTGGSPKLHIFSDPSDFGLRIENEPNLGFESSAFTAVPYSHEMMLIGTWYDGQSAEAYINNFPSRNYIGDVNNSIRIGNAGTVVTGSVIAQKYYKAAYHVRYSAIQNFAWLNNVYQGVSPHDETNELKTLNALASPNTNNAKWDFHALYIFKRPLGDTTRTNIYNAIAAKHKIGLEVQHAYVKGIQWNWNTSTRLCTITGYTALNPVGSATVTAADVQWYWNPRKTGAFEEQYLIPGATGFTIAEARWNSDIISSGKTFRQLYNSNNDWEYIIPRIRAKNSSGETIGYMDGEYIRVY